MVTHDARFSASADRRIFLWDGRIVTEQKRPSFGQPDHKIASTTGCRIQRSGLASDAGLLIRISVLEFVMA